MGDYTPHPALTEREAVKSLYEFRDGQGHQLVVYPSPYGPGLALLSTWDGFHGITHCVLGPEQARKVLLAVYRAAGKPAPEITEAPDGA